MQDKVDEITVYTIYRVTGKEFRWVRKTTTNYRIIGASTQPYNSKKSALENIERTQKEPFTLKYEEVTLFP